MRRHERLQVSWPARIEVDGGNVLQCRIANISRGGALLLLPESESLPDFFHLVDLKTDDRREVRKVWAGANRVGVQYIDGDSDNFGTPVKKRAIFGKRISKT